MIIREIRESPHRAIGSFDWLNDYNDTRRWAQHNCPPDVVALLDAGHAVWFRLRMAELAPVLDRLPPEDCP
jgi:sugar phosphate isomerase/epimerase